MLFNLPVILVGLCIVPFYAGLAPAALQKLIFDWTCADFEILLFTYLSIFLSTNLVYTIINKKSILKPIEIQKLEDYFRIKLVKQQAYTGERQNDTTVEEKSSQFGKRLSELQAQHNFLDREMAQLLKISEPAYLKLVTCKTKPDLDVLNRIKQNFKVSVDYLLYGD